MIIEKMLELIILDYIFQNYNTNSGYKTFLDKNYDVFKMDNRYLELGREFLKDYALNKTEKSD